MPRAALFLLLPIFSSGISPVWGQAGSDSNSAENLVRMHEAWGPKASTKNTSLAIQEFSRSGQVIRLRLVAKGIPKDAIYSIVAWPVTQKGPSEVLKGHLWVC